MDIFGKALLDYQKGNYTEDIITLSSLEEEDVLPLPYLFRSFEKMPLLEQKALGLCKGHVLDIGCGSGNHSLYLQQKGLAVIALDSSPGAIKTSQLRGVEQTVLSDLYDFNGNRFDTLLLLMNGLGIAESIGNLDRFFSHLKTLLRPQGQILLDSSDIIYMFQEDVNEPDDTQNKTISNDADHYGEVVFTMHYKNLKTNPFQWLYLDFDSLEKHALTSGLSCKRVMQGEHYDYLARLSLL